MKGRFFGKVLERSGNFMPPITKGGEKIKPIQSKLLIFFPPIKQEDCLTTRGGLKGWRYFGKREPIETIDTDPKGCFSVKLAPGNYSVFVEYKGKPYTNFISRNFKAGGIEIKNGEALLLDQIVNRGLD